MPSRPILQGVGEDGRAVALDVVRGTAGGDSGGAGRCRFGRPGACGMTTGAHFGARRAAARGTHMKRESPMAIGFLARFVHVRTRFSKPPPSATRPRLRRAKSLENIAFNVNDGSARRAKNAGVAVSGGTWASHVRCAFARTSDATQTKRGARRRYDNFCFPPPRSSGGVPGSGILAVANG